MQSARLICTACHTLINSDRLGTRDFRDFRDYISDFQLTHPEYLFHIWSRLVHNESFWSSLFISLCTASWWKRRPEWWSFASGKHIWSGNCLISVHAASRIDFPILVRTLDAQMSTPCPYFTRPILLPCLPVPPKTQSIPVNVDRTPLHLLRLNAQDQIPWNHSLTRSDYTTFPTRALLFPLPKSPGHDRRGAPSVDTQHGESSWHKARSWVSTIRYQVLYATLSSLSIEMQRGNFPKNLPRWDVSITPISQLTLPHYDNLTFLFFFIRHCCYMWSRWIYATKWLQSPSFDVQSAYRTSYCHHILQRG